MTLLEARALQSGDRVKWTCKDFGTSRMGTVIDNARAVLGDGKPHDRGSFRLEWDGIAGIAVVPWKDAGAYTRAVEVATVETVDGS
ncbi:MAG: hypothetical protein AB7G11_02630 [Phycisphaerales bacterium]